MFDFDRKDIDSMKATLRSLSVQSGEPCVYCGLLSTDKEHVTPKTWIDAMKEMRSMGFDVVVPEELIVPSCRECNLIAGDKLFDNFKEKRQHIANRLLARYNRFLHFEEWDDDEIAELSGRLREQVFYFNELVKIMKGRLRRILKYARKEQ